MVKEIISLQLTLGKLSRESDPAGRFIELDMQMQPQDLKDLKDNAGESNLR